MLTEKDYCDYETCVALKELGYKGIRRYYYTQRDHKLHYNAYDIFYTVRTADAMGYVFAIHLYDAQKWLREEKLICVEVDCCASGYVWELCKAYQGTWFSGGTTIYTHYCEDNENNKLLNDCGKYNTYEDALSEGIKEAVKILKEKE